MNIIFFHKNCPDGFAAALVAKMRFPEATLIGLNHGQTEIDVAEQSRGKDVLMVDFSLRTREENIAVYNASKSFKIYDHHKTAQAELAGLPFAVFDMNRSGCQITWDELFGKYDRHFYDSGHEIRIGPGRKYIGMPEVQRPWWIDFVGDRDLWKHELPESREINSFIMTLPFTETAWRVLESMTAKEAATLGSGALAHVQHYVREVVEHRAMGTIDSGILGISVSGRHTPIKLKYTVAVVNAPYLNISEIGNILATDYANIGMGWFERGDGKIQFSLRSNGEIDVSDIARLYGGGGHKNAAGFQMSREEGRKFIDSILGR